MLLQLLVFGYLFSISQSVPDFPINNEGREKCELSHVKLGSDFFLPVELHYKELITGLALSDRIRQAKLNKTISNKKNI